MIVCAVLDFPNVPAARKNLLSAVVAQGNLLKCLRCVFLSPIISQRLERDAIDLNLKKQKKKKKKKKKKPENDQKLKHPRDKQSKKVYRAWLIIATHMKGSVRTYHHDILWLDTVLKTDVSAAFGRNKFKRKIRRVFLWM